LQRSLARRHVTVIVEQFGDVDLYRFQVDVPNRCSRTLLNGGEQFLLAHAEFGHSLPE
jgi:hypothetical protein